MPDYTTLNISKTEGLATVTLDNGKVNAINTQLSRDLESAFLDLDGDDYISGVVLAGKRDCFCAGLDIKMLATSDEKQLKEFFSAYLSALQTMVRFDKPLVAAMTGYAPAGGTIIALTADYRIMARGAKHTVGMNEFNMSLQIPRMMADVYAYYRGEAAAWADIQHARMYTAEQAVTAGLVNEAADGNQVLAKAEAHCRQLMKVHYPVFKRTKRYLRRGLNETIKHGVNEMVDTIGEDFKDPAFKKMTATFVASLK